MLGLTSYVSVGRPAVFNLAIGTMPHHVSIADCFLLILGQSDTEGFPGAESRVLCFRMS